MLAEEDACAECGSQDDPQMDHIVPVSRGGARLDRANVRRLCGTCNRAKGHRLEGEGGQKISGEGPHSLDPPTQALCVRVPSFRGAV